MLPVIIYVPVVDTGSGAPSIEVGFGIVQTAASDEKKLAVIAAANTLLKQVVGLPRRIKSGCMFDRNYYKKVA